jgi:hypothetical protein
MINLPADAAVRAAKPQPARPRTIVARLLARPSPPPAEAAAAAEQEADGAGSGGDEAARAEGAGPRVRRRRCAEDGSGGAAAGAGRPPLLQIPLPPLGVGESRPEAPSFAEELEGISTAVYCGLSCGEFWQAVEGLDEEIRGEGALLGVGPRDGGDVAMTAADAAASATTQRL